MKRKIFSLCIAAAVLMACMLPVFAAEDSDDQGIQIRASYWQDDTLHVFAHISLEKPEEQNVSLFVNNNLQGQTKPVSMEKAQTSVHYMLLVDSSTSMPRNHKQVLEMARKLMEADTNVTISVARFDRLFSVVGERMTQWEDVNAALQSIAYRGDASDISGSVAEAIRYLGQDGYPEGELTNLIVITDGEPWYSNDPALEKECEERSNQAAEKMMAAYPEVVVHSYSFAPWEEALCETLSAGNGLHMVQIPAEEAGEALADFADSLYGITFPLKGYDGVDQIRDSLMLSIDIFFTSCSNVRNVMIAPEVDIDNIQDENPTEESAPQDPTGTDETTQPNDPTETEGITEPTETDPTGTGTTEETGSTSGTDEHKKHDDEEGEMIRWIVCIAAGCLLGIVILLVVRSASKKHARKDAVPMCFQVVAGGEVCVKKEYYLAREIFIGTDKHSDIVVPWSGGAAAAARIFLQGQIIYVEDMGSADGILINGMRIFSSNRLRSGDEITVGTTTLRVMF